MVFGPLDIAAMLINMAMLIRKRFKFQSSVTRIAMLVHSAFARSGKGSRGDRLDDRLLVTVSEP